MQGVIALNKPSGISSASAANRVKRLLPRGVKIGHAGTLDPFATGILLLLIGKATKMSSSFMGQAKSYDATLKLGATTVTDDPESPEIPTPNAPQPTSAEIEAAAASFVGEISQRPPAFSALKISGQPAYKLARRGEEVDLKPRIVHINAIRILETSWPFVKIAVDCGRGTYIRAIARDLGEILKTGGYLTELTRTRIGEFDLSKSVTLEQLAADGVQPHLHDVSLPNAQHPQQGGQDNQNQR